MCLIVSYLKGLHVSNRHLSESATIVMLLYTVTAILTASCTCLHDRQPTAFPPELLLPADLPDISGLARFRDNSYIAVRDTKGGRPIGPVTTDRLGLISIDPSQHVVYSPLPLSVSWTELPQDLESIAAVPGFTNRFYLLESGGNGTTRRLFTCAVLYGADGRLFATLVAPPLDLRPFSGSLDNVEGLLAIEIQSKSEENSSDRSVHNANTVMLVLADRSCHHVAREAPSGGPLHSTPHGQHDPLSRSTLKLVSLTLEGNLVSSSREWEAEAPPTGALAIRVPTEFPPPEATASSSDLTPEARDDSQAIRICSDLVLGPDRGVYMTSCFDGGPSGPFSSTICRIGSFDGPRFVPDRKMASVSLPGHKFEAISAWSASKDRWNLLLGSDDESAGGYLQLIVPPRDAAQDGCP